MDNQMIDPKYLALIQAGLGILSGNTGRQPVGATIGQGLLGGVAGYQQNLQQQQDYALKKQMADFQGEEINWKKKEHQQKLDAAKKQEEANNNILASLGIGIPASSSTQVDYTPTNFNVLEQQASYIPAQLKQKTMDRDTLYKLGLATSLTGGHGGDALIKYADSQKPNWQNVGGKLVDANQYQGEIPIAPTPMSLAEEARLKYEGVIPQNKTQITQQPTQQNSTYLNNQNLSPKAQSELAVEEAKQNIYKNSAKGKAETAKIENEQEKIAQENLDAEEKRNRNLDAQKSQANLITSKIDEALNLASGKSTGFIGSQLKKYAGTDAYDLEQAVLTVKANIGFQELQAMRANSPTGGALGNVAVQELQALQATLGSLDVGQSRDKLVQNLNAVKTHYQNVLDIMEGKMPKGAGDGNIIPKDEKMPSNTYTALPKKAPKGQIVRNPKTGERKQFDGLIWKTIK